MCYVWCIIEHIYICIHKYIYIHMRLSVYTYDIHDDIAVICKSMQTSSLTTNSIWSPNSFHLPDLFWPRDYPRRNPDDPRSPHFRCARSGQRLWPNVLATAERPRGQETCHYSNCSVDVHIVIYRRSIKIVPNNDVYSIETFLIHIHIVIYI